jgi:hypothetical protein
MPYSSMRTPAADRCRTPTDIQTQILFISSERRRFSVGALYQLIRGLPAAEPCHVVRGCGQCTYDESVQLCLLWVHDDDMYSGLRYVRDASAR